MSLRAAVASTVHGYSDQTGSVCIVQIFFKSLYLLSLLSHCFQHTQLKPFMIGTVPERLPGAFPCSSIFTLTLGIRGKANDCIKGNNKADKKSPETSNFSAGLLIMWEIFNLIFLLSSELIKQ